MPEHFETGARNDYFVSSICVMIEWVQKKQQLSVVEHVIHADILFLLIQFYNI
jgi:hypothetical protein